MSVRGKGQKRTKFVIGSPPSHSSAIDTFNAEQTNGQSQLSSTIIGRRGRGQVVSRSSQANLSAITSTAVPSNGEIPYSSKIRGGRGRGQVVTKPLPQPNSRGRGIARARTTNYVANGSPSNSSDTSKQIVVQTNSQRGGRGRVTGRGRGTALTGASVVDEYSQATSANLPKMDFLKVAEYFQYLRSPELRQAKDSLSAKADYGDNAVGYVKVKTDQSICTVNARLTPQTSVNNKAYNVTVCVEENSKTIINASCDCQSSAGECKHQTAMIFWLLRRSEEPAPTEIACYWRKSVLSTVKELKAKTTDELCKRTTDFASQDDSLLRAFIERGKESNKTAFVIRYSECRKKKTLYIDHLTIFYLDTHSDIEFGIDNFLSYCSQEMTKELCDKVYQETMDQNTKAEWYYQRFSRITATKFYECSNCATADGSLVAAIMGARSFRGTQATKRGQRLEADVLEVLKKKYPTIKKCGIILRGDMPIFGASPDGITEDTIFEIKCPYSDDTVANYVDGGIVKAKVYYQIQLQLLMSNRSKGILVIVDPKFEENKKISEWKVDLDENKLKPVLSRCEAFWKNVIFPLLK